MEVNRSVNVGCIIAYRVSNAMKANGTPPILKKVRAEKYRTVERVCQNLFSLQLHHLRLLHQKSTTSYSKLIVQVSRYENKLDKNILMYPVRALERSIYKRCAHWVADEVLIKWIFGHLHLIYNLFWSGLYVPHCLLFASNVFLESQFSHFFLPFL